MTSDQFEKRLYQHVRGWFGLPATRSTDRDKLYEVLECIILEWRDFVAKGGGNGR